MNCRQTIKWREHIWKLFHLEVQKINNISTNLYGWKYIAYNSTVIAHAGDGNFHTVILFDPKEDEQRKEAERLNHLMVYKALSMEGTVFFFLLFPSS